MGAYIFSQDCTDVQTGPDQVLSKNDEVWKNNDVLDNAGIKNMVGPDQVSGKSLNILSRAYTLQLLTLYVKRD